MNCRRRPKGRLTSCQSPTILAAMAKQVIISQQQQQQKQKDPNETTTLLSDECTQYLRSIEVADKFSNAPNAIDQSAWNHLCRLRRSKIEIEFKVRRREHPNYELRETRTKSMCTFCHFLGTICACHVKRCRNGSGDTQQSGRLKAFSTQSM